MQELISKWNEFHNWVIENVPHYDDNTFTFNNFMEWLSNQQMEQPHDY